MGSKVAVVTGSNKGLGFQVVKNIAAQWDGIVYLTSRNEKLGKEAMAEAKKELGEKGGKLRYHQLDIDAQASIDAFKAFLAKEHGHLDILVNNAGIAYKLASTTPFAEQAKVTNAINYFGTRNVSHALFPLLAPHARVVNVASRAGTMTAEKCSAETLAKFTGAKTEAEVDALMEQFVALAQAGEHEAAGFPGSAYGMSKLGEIALSEVQGKALAADSTRRDLVLNSCTPGFVATDMTSQQGTKSVEDGADTITYLALLPPDSKENPVAQFVGDRKVINWRG